jgi:hypothetical protein
LRVLASSHYVGESAMNHGLRGLNLMSPVSGEPVAIESNRAAIVLVVVHSEKCDECREYVSSIWHARDEVFQWDERVIVAVRNPSGDTPDFGAPTFEVLIDDEHKLPISGTGVMVADEWGEVFHATAGHHRFLAPSALAEWLRFVAMQCPECEQPEGPWREIQSHGS